MKKNIFNTFIEKVEDFPLWLKQVICIRLSQELQAEVCEKFLKEKSDDIFSLYQPILTFKGSEELKNKKSGLDLNTYNFLEFCANNANISDITLNTFLSPEEVAKYFIFAIEQGFVEKPQNTEIEAIAGFIAGKFRTGEYFAKKGMLNDSQIQKAIDIQSKSSKKFAEILVDLGFIKQEDIGAMLRFKEEAKKRFVLDSACVPEYENQFCKKEDEYIAEIEKLKSENLQLKKKISQLLEIVRTYD